MTKQEAEREAIRRWYRLPLERRQSFEHAVAFSHELQQQLGIETITDKQRLIAAWLIREMERVRLGGAEPGTEDSARAA